MVISSMVSSWIFVFLVSTRATSCFALATGSNDSMKRMSDVAIVGCGVLGTSLCRQLLSSPKFDAKTTTVTGITKTTNRHESIREAIGPSDRFHLRTNDDISKGNGKKYSDVVFCAPPSGFDDYAGAVQDAMDNLWAGPDHGKFVFTSSGGIYGPGKSGEIITETTPLPPNPAPRSAKLVNTERVCRSRPNTAILRLAGLYNLERGAHNYWMGIDVVKGREDGVINLLHYDDAAGACIAALTAALGDDAEGGGVFLVSDGNPMTRRAICESTLKSTRYADRTMPDFEAKGDGESTGKVYDTSWTNRVLGWKPVYPSFDEFMSNS